MKARAAVLVVVAAIVAVSLMHGEAHAQTNIKIGVLLSHPDDIDVGPWEAMKLAEMDLNREYVAIESMVMLERIDVSDYLTDPMSVGQKIIDALENGSAHFIAPSDEGALGVVKGAVDGIVSIPSITHNPILISPKSQTVFHPLYNSDDNLFRLTPNNDELAKVTIPVYDKYNTEQLIMVIDAARGSGSFPAPTAVADRFMHDYNGDGSDTFEPILVYNENAPDSAEKNLEQADKLNDRLGDLITTYGENRVGVHFVSDVPHYNTFVNVINDNPSRLYNLDSVRWYGTEAILVDRVTADPLMAEFSAKVNMTILAYEIVETPIINKLKDLPNTSGLHNVYANYAAYDAVHLLADSIAIAGGADNPNLKEIIFQVANDGTHALNHTTRLLGAGALGDYKLDRQTGDLFVGVGNFIEHRLVQDNGGYVWLELFDRGPLVCR